jgi:RNA polymerase sigma factor (sigma-70 family)
MPVVAGEVKPQFERAFRENRQKVKRIVAKIMRSCRTRMSDDVEEIVQYVFFRVWGVLIAGPRCQEALNAPYLAAVARNAACDWRKTRLREIVDAGNGEAVAAVVDESAELEFERQVMLRRVRIHLGQLAGTAELIFRMRFVYGLSQKYVSQALGISRQQIRTIESRIKRDALKVASTPQSLKGKERRTSS